ncbi:MAG: GNAT family N-acetyltransferase [Rhodocyclaceae bacterium]|nr:GNAT family N-acetyltransferase [Rhodocyclaceae bacterium]
MTQRFAPMRVVATGDLSLEPQLAAHAADMFEVLSDSAIYEYENEPPSSPAWLTDRYTRLESRQSADASQQWLNWVIRLPDGTLAGYVQATIYSDARAAIAYVLGSRYWGQGLARCAVRAMIRELAAHHGVRSFSAVLKRNNYRSTGLLERLGFAPATAARCIELDTETDELAYVLERAEDLLE